MLTVVLAVGLILGLMPVGIAQAATVDDEPAAQLAREIRPWQASDFGASRPVGITYDANRGEFVIASSSSSGAVITRVTHRWDRVTGAALPDVGNPSTVVFDPADDAVRTVEDDSLVNVAAGSLSGRAVGNELPLRGAQLDDPNAATFDSATGDLLVVDGDTLKRVSSDGTVDGSTDLPEVGDSDLIAVNPADGLLYVYRSGTGQLDAYDGAKRVTSYDTSAIEMASPAAMTFAPSTNSTDDPGIHHLFVADTGNEAFDGGVMEITLEQPIISQAHEVVGAGHVQTIDTTLWEPLSSDPSGIVWNPDVDELIVVDSEINEIPQFDNVNMWHVTRSTGDVARTGATWGPFSANYSDEPTGLGYDRENQRLFISDDTGTRAIYVVTPGDDGEFGTMDDEWVEIDVGGFLEDGLQDPEDPTYDPVTGHLFFVSGVDTEIFRIDPGPDGEFGTGDDVVTHFDIGHLGPGDYEGLASSPSRRTLFAAARTTNQIFEITHEGQLVREIVVDIEGMRTMSGLAMAPSTAQSGEMGLWIVDRGVDPGSTGEFGIDGQLHEISVPDLDGPVGNLPPVVTPGADQTIVFPATATLEGSVSDDGLPEGQTLTHSWSKASGPGDVTFVDATDPTTTASFSEPGLYVLELTATDTEYTVSASVTITVEHPPNQPPTIQPIDDVTVEEGFSAAVPVVVSDPDGDELTITHDELPTFGKLEEGGGQFTFTPGAGDAGTYGPFTVTVSDAQPGAGETPVFRSAASNSNITPGGSVLVIDKPDGTQEGDLLLAQIRYRGDVPRLTAPSGWVELGTIPDRAQSQHVVLYKIAGASEPASYEFDQNLNEGRMAGGIGAYSGVNRIQPIDTWAASGNRTETLEAPAVETTVDNTRVVRLWGWRGMPAEDPAVGHNVPPDGVDQRWSEQEGQSSGSGPDRNRVLAGDHAQATAGLVGEAVASGSESAVERNRSSFTVALAPIPEGLTASTSFQVTVTEAQGPVNTPPQAIDDAAATAFETPVDIDVLANDSDADGDDLTVVDLSSPADGSVSVLGDQSVRYVPDAGFSGTDTFTYRASDGRAVSNVATVTVVVADDDGRTPDPEPEPDPDPDGDPPTDWFLDDDGNVFEADINAIATEGITRGCNPPVNDQYCPDGTVTRGQMAAFLVRALNLTDAGAGDLFDDDNDSVFEGDIDRLATAGITRGCNPPTNSNFCPDDPVTRGQMAAFLVRALGYADDGGGDLFVDDDGHVFEGDIDRLATAGVTRGCNPPDNDRFCPDDNVTRGQMAAFLARALIYGR